jgi:hypothetical protein
MSVGLAPSHFFGMGWTHLMFGWEDWVRPGFLFNWRAERCGMETNLIQLAIYCFLLLLPQTRSSIPRSSCRHRPHPPCSLSCDAFLMASAAVVGFMLHRPYRRPCRPTEHAQARADQWWIPKAELVLIRPAADLPQADPKLSLMPSSMSCWSSQPWARIAMLRPCCSLLSWWPPEPRRLLLLPWPPKPSPPAPTRHGCTSPHSGEETRKRRGI